ncbi:RNA polymerase sigma factor [Nocardioides xinjiangensis]|uniref:RNA polymerase sigma factor n=1 Tax=Nocardioides xinjiangensis TaxID=2817376 RepID=UPI001B309DB9|nr:sigma-70 family RNA polymerase sigma factor [Nocardioides sp. SYSU D00514]
MADLVVRASEGDRAAWEQLVERYVGLVWRVTRGFNLAESDRADVTQTTWLRLYEHIDRLDDPSRVGAWLTTTARRECLRQVAFRKKVVLTHGGDVFEAKEAPQPAVDEQLLAGERVRDVRAAIGQLPAHWQDLMYLLMADPPLPYSEIAERLCLPIGSIGPTRGRCLDRLRVLLDA